MTERPLCMLTLPNSGSTWLASLIAKHSRFNAFAMEFFNPVRTQRHASILSRAFGSELMDGYQNIATPPDDLLDRDLHLTWDREDWNFTKEVFSPYKLPWFAKHFRCFVLLRSAFYTFPPRRPRIWAFYVAAWHALRERGVIVGSEKTIEQRALKAHAVMSRQLVADAITCKVPVVNYFDLFDRRPENVHWLMTSAIGECSAALLEAIASTRVLARRADLPALIDDKKVNQ